MAEVQERVAKNLVTSENLVEFNNKKLGIEPPKAEPKKEEPKAEAKKEEPKAEAKPEEKKEEPKKESGISQRFSEMAEQRRKVEAERDAEKAAREKAEKERDDLQARLAPKPQGEVGEKPTLAQFNNDADKWGEALLAWHEKKKEKDESERQAKITAEQQARVWAERVNQTKREIPDFQAKIDANKGVEVTEDMKLAIMESEVGPLILLHFADHPEEAARISRLTPVNRVREIGKLEVTVKKPEPKKEEPKKDEPKAEISKAPEPIEPVKTVAGGEVTNYIDSKGEFTGTPAQWKALRKAKKI